MTDFQAYNNQSIEDCGTRYSYHLFIEPSDWYLRHNPATVFVTNQTEGLQKLELKKKFNKTYLQTLLCHYAH